MKRKKSEIQTSSVDYYPRAECEGCSWRVGPSPQTRQNAKDHAFYYAGHLVRVTTESISQYILPVRESE